MPPSASTTCTSSAGSPWTRGCGRREGWPSSRTAEPCRAAGPRSVTRAATAFSGGCSAPTTPAPSSPATCTTPRRRWAPTSRPRCHELIAATDPGNVQRWVLRDRKALKQWSKGRATLVGDAAHPTSPYAAYGAGMATEDGYFLGRRLAGVDLSDYAAVRAALDAFEAPRKPHTARQVQQAFILGKVFHHAPAAAAGRPRRGPRPHPVPAEGRRRVLAGRDPRPDRRDRRSRASLHGGDGVMSGAWRPPAVPPVAQAAEHPGVGEADRVRGSLHRRAVPDQVLGPFRPENLLVAQGRHAGRGDEAASEGALADTAGLGQVRQRQRDRRTAPQCRPARDARGRSGGCGAAAWRWPAARSRSCGR